MPFLIAGVERYALRLGRNVVGGQGQDAVPLMALAGFAPAAVVIVHPDRTSTIQRLTAGVVVTVDGETLDSAEHPLSHGARLGIGPCRLMFADPSAERRASAEAATEIAPTVPAAFGPLSATDLVAGVSGPPRDAETPKRPAKQPAAASAEPVRQAPPRPLALLEITAGPIAATVYRIERAVCSIGRAESNDVRVAHDSVSSSHATLLLKRGTWYVVDLQSANGTYVDGYRVAGERALPEGATLRTGDVTMRLRMLTNATKASDPTRMAGGFWRRLARRLNG